MIKQLTLLTILLVSNQVLADICASQKTQSGCAGVTGCAYTVSGSSCTNNCNGLSQTDCTNSTNSSYCSYSQGGCINKTDCSTLTTSATCGGNAACSFTPATGTCAVSGNSLATYCSSLTSSSTCSSDPKCSYVASSFTCSFKPGQCVYNLTDSSCDDRFCTKTDRSSNANATGCIDSTPVDNCTNQTNPNDCFQNHCDWTNDNTCVSYCPIINSRFSQEQGSCEQLSACSLSFCTDNKVVGDTTCRALGDAISCSNAPYCIGSTTPAQCVPKNTYCTSATTSTTCDSASCAFTPTTGSHDTCTNNFDCTSLLDSSSCGNNSKCTYNTGCSNKNSSSCNNSDSQATCTGTGKFCTFSQQGSCAAISSASGSTSTTSGSAISAVKTISSLLLVLAFL